LKERSNYLYHTLTVARTMTNIGHGKHMIQELGVCQGSN